MSKARKNDSTSSSQLKQSVKSSSKSRKKSGTTTQKANCTQKSFAILTRGLFLLHASIALWRVWLTYPSYYMYFLCIGIAGLLVEMVYTLAVRQGNEYKWFCPSVFFYLLSVVPCLWLLELGKLNEFMQLPVIDGGCNLQAPEIIMSITVNRSIDSSSNDLERKRRNLNPQLFVTSQNETKNFVNTSPTLRGLLETTREVAASNQELSIKIMKNQKNTLQDTTFSTRVSAFALITDMMEEGSAVYFTTSKMTSNGLSMEGATQDSYTASISTTKKLNKAQRNSTKDSKTMSTHTDTNYYTTSNRTETHIMPRRGTIFSTQNTNQLSTQAITTGSNLQTVSRQLILVDEVEKTYVTKQPKDYKYTPVTEPTNEKSTKFSTKIFSKSPEVTHENNYQKTTDEMVSTSLIHMNNRPGLEDFGKKMTNFGKNTLTLLKNTTNKVNEFLDKLDPENWLLALHQVLLFVLVIGRWLLPKGEITRDQLSQLLLVFIGVGADILEFVTETINNDSINARCNVVLHYIIYGVWSWSLLQFTLVLTAAKSRKTRVGFSSDRVTMISGRKTCCTGTIFNNADVWGIIVTMLLQDVPFLAFRLYMMIVYEQVHQMMIFFTGKNILVVCLQVYRLIVLQFENKVPKTHDLNASELRPLKGTLERLTSQSSASSISEGNIKNASFKTRNDGSVVVKIYLDNEATMKKK